MTEHTRGAKGHKSNRELRSSQKQTSRGPVTGDNVPFTTSAAPLPDITELTAEHILYLQRTVGNSAVARLLGRTRAAGQPAPIVERHLPAGSEQPAIVQRDATDESTGLESAKFSGDSVLEATFRGERFIMQGSQGSAVQKVQEVLESINFPLEVFGADGIFGDETRLVVSAYQMAHDITKGGKPYGFVGPRTLHGLDQELAGKEPQPEDAVFFQDLLDFLAERGEERFPISAKAARSLPGSSRAPEQGDNPKACQEDDTALGALWEQKRRFNIAGRTHQC